MGILSDQWWIGGEQEGQSRVVTSPEEGYCGQVSPFSLTVLDLMRGLEGTSAGLEDKFFTSLLLLAVGRTPAYSVQGRIGVNWLEDTDETGSNTA